MKNHKGRSYQEKAVLPDATKRKRSNFIILGKNLFHSAFGGVGLLVIFAQNAFAYLDPGTGSYIFQGLIAAFVIGVFTIKNYWQKIKDFFRNHFPGKDKR